MAYVPSSDEEESESDEDEEDEDTVDELQTIGKVRERL